MSFCINLTPQLLLSGLEHCKFAVLLQLGSALAAALLYLETRLFRADILQQQPWLPGCSVEPKSVFDPQFSQSIGEWTIYLQVLLHLLTHQSIEILLIHC